jgi:hypothetical protein
MCEKHKIAIKLTDESLEVEGTDKRWVEGNAKQFLDRIHCISQGSSFCCNGYVVFGIIYFFASVLLFIFWVILNSQNLLSYLFENNLVKDSIWCSSWSFLGISACLINIRSGKPRILFHFIFYYLFVFFVALLLSVSVKYYWLEKPVYSLSASALLALVIGFLGHRLNEVASGFIKIK